MGDGDLDIRGGGAVSVDSETLRVAADGFGVLGRELDDIAAVAGSAGALVGRLPREEWHLSARIADLVVRIHAERTRAEGFDAELRHAAAVYDLVELQAQRALAAAGGDEVAAARWDAAIAALERRHPGALLSARAAVMAAEAGWPLDLAKQSATGTWWLPFGGALLSGAGAYSAWQTVRRIGGGTIPSGERLTAMPAAVQVRPLAPTRRTSAPATLAQAAERIPGGGESRIRVEKYTMPDGSRQFALYVAGTQAPAGFGGDDPFDELSNVQLYAGVSSASYQATLEALRQAGAQPGDVLHDFGHSQGAMITAHVALEAGYDARTHVTFGSPVEADVGGGTLSVAVAHTDDPVAALQGGGHREAVGAPGSFVARREADPAGGVRDLGLPAHGMDGYVQTAGMLDRSGDPRMDGVRAVFDELGTATSVQVTEYSAARVLPVPAAPHPQPGPAPLSPSSSPGAG